MLHHYHLGKILFRISRKSLRNIILSLSVSVGPLTTDCIDITVPTGLTSCSIDDISEQDMRKLSMALILLIHINSSIQTGRQVLS